MYLGHIKQALERKQAMDKNRRNILKVLGLTTVATPLSIDDMALAGRGSIDGNNPVPVLPGEHLRDGVATALESLAKGIRDGEANVVDMKVVSGLASESFVSHDLHIKIELLRDVE